MSIFTIIYIGIITVIGYFVSLLIHPLTRCPACTDRDGRFRHPVAVAAGGLVYCQRCGGTGRVVRFGVRAFLGGTKAESGGLRRALEDSGADAAAVLAGWLAGSKYAHLRSAWNADLYGDPEHGEPSPGRRLRLAAGFVVAAVRVRLQGLTDLAWRPVDALLSSWHGSNLATLMPVTVAAGLFLTRDGFYGLLLNAENLGVIAGAPWAAIKGLRKYRQIDTPKRPERQTSADDPQGVNSRHDSQRQ
jgi:hypothetical protein